MTVKYLTIIKNKGHTTWKLGEHYHVLLTFKRIMDGAIVTSLIQWRYSLTPKVFFIQSP